MTTFENRIKTFSSGVANVHVPEGTEHSVEQFPIINSPGSRPKLVTKRFAGAKYRGQSRLLEIITEESF